MDTSGRMDTNEWRTWGGVTKEKEKAKNAKEKGNNLRLIVSR